MAKTSTIDGWNRYNDHRWLSLSPQGLKTELGFKWPWMLWSRSNQKSSLAMRMRVYVCMHVCMLVSGVLLLWLTYNIIKLCLPDNNHPLLRQQMFVVVNPMEYILLAIHLLPNWKSHEFTIMLHCYLI